MSSATKPVTRPLRSPSITSRASPRRVSNTSQGTRLLSTRTLRQPSTTQRTPPQATHIPASAPHLDPLAVPHLFELIASFADWPDQLNMRKASRALRAQVDRHLFKHILLTMTTSKREWCVRSVVAPYPRLPYRLPKAPHQFKCLQPGCEKCGSRLIFSVKQPPLKEPVNVPALPLGSPLIYTHTVDSWASGYHRSVPDLPTLPSIVRTRTPLVSFLGAKEEINYLDLRNGKGGFVTREIGSFSVRNWVIHILLDETFLARYNWHCGSPYLPPPSHLVHIDQAFWGSDIAITLVLHYSKHHKPPTADPVTFEYLKRLLFPRHIPEPDNGSYTIAGLEECPPQVLGLPKTSTPAQVQDKVVGLDESHRQVKFSSKSEWAARVHALESELPSHLVNQQTILHCGVSQPRVGLTLGL